MGFCKDKQEKFVGRIEGNLKRWSEYFQEVYVAKEVEALHLIEEINSLTAEDEQSPIR